MKFRAAVATAAAVPLALGLAACGGNEPAATGYKPSVPAVTPTATTSTTAPKQAVPVAHLDSASFMPAMKKGMAGKDTARMTMRMVAGGQTMTVSGAVSMNPVAAQLDLVGAAFGGRMKLILVDDVAYVSSS